MNSSTLDPDVLITDKPLDQAAPSQNTTALASMQAVRFRIPGDQILKATAGYSDPVREAVRWAGGYCRDRNLSHGEFGAMLVNKYGEPYSSDSVWKMFTGRRDESELGPIVESIQAFRRSVDEVMGRTVTGFIRTRITDTICKTLERARARHKFTCIFGESQIGKTTAATEYTRSHNHGETIFVRMPTRGAMGDFLEELAIRLGIPTQQKARELRRRIIESFDERMLLIVDECHQCLCGHYSTRALATLDFCREIHDRRKCGVVLMGTNTLRDGITRGPNARMLRQLWLRCYAPLQLPDRPSSANLADFAKAFGLEPAGDRIITVNFKNDDGEDLSEKGNPAAIQLETINQWGLGRWLSILQEAAEDAREAGQRITWGRVIRVHAQFRSMELPTV